MDHGPIARSGWFVGPIFFALAGWMAFGPDLTSLPIEATPAVPADALTTAPRRSILAHPPTIRLGGPYDRTCMDCHRLPFATNDDPKRVLFQHAEIRVQHGADKRCLDCHSERNRDLLVLRSGEEITFEDVPRLCGQCHAPTYKDWVGGMHGRTNGSWSAALGTVERLKCSHCHDPHAPRHPALDPLAPLPGPRTLRMGERHPHDEAHAETSRDPLHRALRIERRPARPKPQAPAAEGDASAEKTTPETNATEKESHR